MHIPRKPGEQIEVDWAGDTTKVIDSSTGEIIPCYLFIGVLNYSLYAYVEAFFSMDMESWITAHIHMYQYFGGSTRMLIPDNLRTAVDHSDWYTPKMNKTYHEMAEHYDTAVIPARVRAPKDKPFAEGTVGVISTWITAAIRNEKFFSLAELNCEIHRRLESFNHAPFQKKEGSRYSVFLSDEKPFLTPLPPAPYELSQWKQATVQFNYHISVDKMQYSVPYLSFRSFIHNCGFYQLYNKQLSKNAQNIRNPDSLFGIIKVTKQKPTKQKKRGLLMLNSTTNTYTLKRKILSFSNKISRHLSKPERKFTADITYGLLASGSCLLTDVVDQLHESSKKINIVDRLSRHLEKGTPGKAVASYLHTIKKWVPDEPVIHFDDSDVVKPDGYKFEALGIVRDGSESTSTKNVYKKGYHVTEACVLTSSNHPVSIFSRIHSSSERDYKSANTITFQAMEQGAALFKKATFAMDRGYDDNKMFLKMDELGQDYVIRLKSNRKLLYHNKWTMAIELRNRRKGKVKTNVFYKGKDHEAYLSHVKVQITASRKDIYLVLVYGITEHPMMLATNKEIKSKEDVIRVARTYFSRWKIEEYFRCKKQMFQFENFRVRKLVSINALNFYITLCMAFLAIISMESETNALKVSIIKSANPIKEKVFFCYYRLAKGISGILSYAKEGVRLWFRTKRPAYRQLCLKLVA